MSKENNRDIANFIIIILFIIAGIAVFIYNLAEDAWGTIGPILGTIAVIAFIALALQKNN